MEQDHDQQVLPTGFRFYPTEEELITFYLQSKLHGHQPDLDRVIPSVDIYSFEPSELPELAGELCKKDMEQWFFFVPQQEREARGGRPIRTTNTGYWKATGSTCPVYSSQNNKVIGMKKTMVFYKGKAPHGKKTKWKMNEYKAIKQDDALNNMTNNASSAISPPVTLRQEFSLCRVYVTSGCARAFDRRPPGTMPFTNTQSLGSRNNQTGQELAGSSRTAETSSRVRNTDQSVATVMFMERSSSTGISDESGGGNEEEAANAYDLEMADALGSLLDWEYINWS